LKTTMAWERQGGSSGRGYMGILQVNDQRAWLREPEGVVSGAVKVEEYVDWKDFRKKNELS